MIGLRMNLHTHLEGWVRPATARELARSTRVAEPPKGWEAALRMREKGDLTQFLRRPHDARTRQLSAG